MKRITWINLILGIWLIVSPFALGHSANAVVTANNIIFGGLFVVASAWILAEGAGYAGMNWFQLLCSIWVIVSPFALGYQQLTRAMQNDVIVGVIALIVTLIEAWAFTSKPIAA
jgi:hypothetical protein